jgi:hypothetical protein
MKSEILLTLIKEVIKKEVKEQVKEEITKLVKSGAIELNSKKKSTPSLSELTNPKPTQTTIQQRPQQPKREFTKDPMINEILNMTQPFTAQQRAEGGAPGMGGGSILDAIQPKKYEEDGWETMDYTNVSENINVRPAGMQNTNDAGLDALTKALSRDYSELVKRFK